MGSGRTGCHHHPVEVVRGNCRLDCLELICRTGKQTIGRKSHAGKCAHILGNRFNVDGSGDVDSAMADKNPDPRLFPADIAFFGYGGSGCQRASRFGQQGGGSLRGTAALLDGIRNVPGTLGHPADIDARPGCGDSVQRTSNAEAMCG